MRDPFGPGYAADPHAVFDALRATAPVYRSDRLGRFVLTRYADAAAVLHDPVTYSSAVVPRVPARDRDLLAEFTRWSERWLFFLDPPEHGVRRAPVARALAPRSLAGAAGRIAAHADALLAGLSPDGFDLLADFAHPLAASVIADLLCAPGPETDRFRAHARAMEHAGIHARDPAARRAGLEAIAAATAALRARVEARGDAGAEARGDAGAEARGDAGVGAGAGLPPVPAALFTAWDDPDQVGAHSLVLLFAGVETTQNLLANTVHTLLSADRWTTLRAGGLPLTGVVEEAARLDPPVLGVLRRTTRDVTLSGVPVPAGAELVVMVAAANRDPATFADPHALDVRRSPNPHLSFGVGPHYCPGAALTRRTVRTALDALLTRFPTLRITDAKLSWRDHDPIVRGLTRLPVHAP